MSDTTVGSIAIAGSDRIMIHARREGYRTITARTRSTKLPLLVASTSIKILTLSKQPSPVAATDFRVVEYSPLYSSRWFYAPQLTLSAIGLDSAQIVSVTVEMQMSDLPTARPPFHSGAQQGSCSPGCDETSGNWLYCQ